MATCWQPDCSAKAIINDAWCLLHCPDGTPVTMPGLPAGLIAQATDAGVYGFRATRLLTATEQAQVEAWLNARYPH